MPKNEDIRHSVLIVSAFEQFDAVVRKTMKGCHMVESGKSAAMARRYILERYYDLVVINTPLPDERGEELALDIVRECNASVLLVAPADALEDMQERTTDYGILVLTKPLPIGQLSKAIRFLFAIQNRIHTLEKKIGILEERIEDGKIVNKAKFLLMEKKRMAEDEAHRFIGKQAMDQGISRRKAAEKIMEDLEQ